MNNPSSIDPELRARLNLAKLRAVVRAHTGATDIEDRPVGALAAVVVGGDGYVLLGGNAGLGAALVWARRQQVTGSLHVIVDADADQPADAGVIARRAAFFAAAPIVFRLVGTELTPATPSPHLPVRQAEPAMLAAIEPLRLAGADIVVEHGVVMAELSGLEVGRVVADQEGSGVHLEIGVGHHDREASQIMGALYSGEQMTHNVLDVVRVHRSAAAPPHLLNRLARQRWLRAELLADPSLVGARRLTIMEPPLPRPNLVDPAPAFAVGEALDGSALVVACAVGVDVEAIPTAADGRDRFDPDATLVYVCPRRDQYPVVRDLAAALVRPARLVALDGQWVD